jgi:DNA-binding transcriptional LysR family regulator
MSIDITAGLRVFATVVECDGFAAAADRLNLSRGMTSRYVAQLESHFGVRLLNRTTRRLSLTEAGADQYQRAVQILAMIEDARAAAAHLGQAPRGLLRITSPSIFALSHLDRAVTLYQQRYPGVEIELSVNDRIVDVVEEGFDLALRITRDLAPGLVARPLAPVRLWACASPAYLKRHGTPCVPQDLSQHNCLCFAGVVHRNGWPLRRGTAMETVQVRSDLRSNFGYALLNAAIEGRGIIYEPSFLVHQALRDGRLVRVLPDWTSAEYSLFAIYPNRRFLAPKVRSFIDFLVEHIGREPYWEAEL